MLEELGWSPLWANAFSADNSSNCVPARVLREHRGAYSLLCEAGEVQAEVSGRFRHSARMRRDFPTVGDWVAAEIPHIDSRAVIHSVLPRHSAFVRRSAGTKGEEQVVAANVDTVFLVSGLDHDFNLRRIERYLTLAYESGADPIIVLNKADVLEDLEHARQQAEGVAYGVPVLVVSAATGRGLDELRKTFTAGMTGALLGSSGVGKSTLVNALLGREALRTAAVRENDSKGRHTTSHRELIPLPGGAVLIDTPGMRELQLLADDSSLAQSFDEIAEASVHCRFKDCSHTGEPGCAVQAALAEGRIEMERYESYLRQCKEIRHHQIEQDIHQQIEEKKRWKAIHRSMKFHHKPEQR
ncbi:MAG: ribosome small subunit-dependent GTPase A [Planctomycetes bacterium]|nr:ribosome small subunit-dependent GTPase A [Planctomycetota bacterium]